MQPKVVITGANGYVGGLLCRRLLDGGWPLERLVAVDLADSRRADLPARLSYRSMDIRDPGLVDLVRELRVEVIVHLAAVVTVGAKIDRTTQFEIDVGGTENVLQAALGGGCRRLVVTSSGAAYGYHPDHPRWLDEEHPLRGNEEFAYAHHKRLVEELLERARDSHPELEQVVLRMGTVLGEATHNQITALWDGPLLLGVAGGDDRFVFIWDHDVVCCLERAIADGPAGIYNLAGDGAVAMSDIASRLDKRYLRLPEWLLRSALGVGKLLGVTDYGPEQVRFLKYRPVLSNRRLVETFGYQPMKSSSETLEIFAAAREQAADGAVRS